MAGGYYVAAARAEGADVVLDFLFHLIDRAERDSVLVVDRPVEDQLVTEVRFQTLALHSLAAPLDRVEDFDADVDRVGQDLA